MECSDSVLQIDLYCQTQGYTMVGYYHANENNDAPVAFVMMMMRMRHILNLVR